MTEHAPVTAEHMGLALSILQLDAAVAAQPLADYESRAVLEERQAVARLVLVCCAQISRLDEPWAAVAAKAFDGLRLAIERGEHRK